MNLPNKVDGSLYTPQEWNEFKNELQNWIIASGQTLTGNSLQVTQAAARYAANAASYTDSGIADAYSLVSMNTNDTVTIYANGTIVSFKAGATNTGNSTLAISGLAAKAIKKDGFASNLVAGDIVAGRVYSAFYSLSDDAFEISEYVTSASGGGSSVPAGFQSTWPTDTVPAGYLERDGSAINRVTYAALFAEIGVDYGNGNGTTTFNIPDMRGEVERGWDHGAGNDPDSASRTDRGDGTTGDNVGTKQLSEFGAHYHHQGLVADPNAPSLTTRYGIEDTGINATHYDTGSTFGGDWAASTSTEGGNETRGRNVYSMFIIKY